MATRRLDINLHFDTAESDRQQSAARTKSKQMSDAMISDADAAEKAKLEFVKRANAQKVQELARANKTETELNKDAEAQAKRLDEERITSEKKKAQAAIQAQKNKVQEATKFIQQEEKAQDKLNASQIGGVKSLLQMSAAFFGLSSASSIMAGMQHDLDKTSAYAHKTAEDLLKIRGLVRELAALRGDMGSTGATAAHVLSVQAQTLQSTEDVNAMEQAGLGVGELAIGKSITKGEFDKAMVSAGKMQTLEGGSADAYGALTGQIALQSDHEMKADEVQARMNRMFQIQQPGGFRNMSQAATQYAELNGHVMNKILTPEQAMGTLSAFSVSSPGQAATKTDQFIRATLGNQVRARGGQINPELDTEKTYEYMKSLGVDKTNDPIAIGKAIAADMKSRAGKDKNFSPYRHLQLHGFGNQQDRNVIMDFAGMYNTDKLSKIEAAQNAPLDMGAIDRRFNDRVAKDTFFQSRQAEIANQIGSSEQGLREEPYEIARKSAFARLQINHAIRGTYDEWNGLSRSSEVFVDTAALRDPSSNSYGAIRGMTTENLRREARRLKIPVDDNGSAFAGDEEEKELARKIQMAGGDLTGGVGKSMAASVDKFAKSVDRLEKALSPKGPPALIQGKPNRPALRP